MKKTKIRWQGVGKKNETKRSKSNFAQYPLWRGLWGLVPVVVVVILGLDFFRSKNVKTVFSMRIEEKPADVAGHMAMARVAARAGDMGVARKEYQLAEELGGGKLVLGVNSETEELVWPEEAVREQLRIWEEEAKETASSKLYLRISAWYWRLGDEEKAREFYTQAAEIDPNDPLVLTLKRLLGGD